MKSSYFSLLNTDPGLHSLRSNNLGHAFVVRSKTMHSLSGTLENVGNKAKRGSCGPLQQQGYRTMRACTQNNNTTIPEDATLTSVFGQWSKNAAALVGHMGKHSYIRTPFDCTMGCDIWIGDDVFVGAGSVYISSTSAMRLLNILSQSRMSGREPGDDQRPHEYWGELLD